MDCQTDSTRAKQQELQYQQRLTAELEKLRDQETQNLTQLSENLSAEAELPEQPSLVERISDATSTASTLAEKQHAKDITRDIVTREIEALKKKLESRKKMFPHEVDPALSKAKEDVVTCLRLKDRRPLDCWQEVETFKSAVDRQAKEFVEKTIV